MDTLLFLGVLAGVLQLVGYYIYMNHEGIDPNPVTWFMFAYGTAILTILEWDKNATIAELILPSVCATLAIVVSIKCWLSARKQNPQLWWPRDWWPDDFWERGSFVSDIVITVGYLGIWGLVFFNLVTAGSKEMAVFWFLFLSNVSTFPSFYPIISTTLKNPEREYWLPWIIWGLAYALLALVTYLTQGSFWNILMFYPVSNAAMHLLVGIISINQVGLFLKSALLSPSSRKT